jgi:hypothetical protein
MRLSHRQGGALARRLCTHVGQLSCLRNRQMLSDTSTSVNTSKATTLGQSVTRPLPFSKEPRTMAAKW